MMIFSNSKRAARAAIVTEKPTPANVAPAPGLIGQPAAGPAPAPACASGEQQFDAARQATADQFFNAVRFGVDCLRKLGQHEFVINMLQQLMEETIAEARSLAARKAAHAAGDKRRPARRLTPTRAATPAEIN